VRFPIPLDIEISDDELAGWAAHVGVPIGADGKVRAKDAVALVRAQVLSAVTRDFSVLGVRADVTIKR
jgi:hypothetical protein